MISWNESKNNLLKAQRGLSFEEASTEIAEGRLLAVLPHPLKENQKYMLSGYMGMFATSLMLQTKMEIFF